MGGTQPLAVQGAVQARGREGRERRRAREEDGEEGQRRKRREKGELTYDFENVGEPDEARFTLAATAEELLLVSAPTAVDTLLPPDLGYDAADLAKLSLRPNAGCPASAERRGWRRRPLGGAADDDDGFGDAYDDDAGFGGGFGNDDGDHVGVDDAVDPDAVGPDGLVAAPRRVEKIPGGCARHQTGGRQGTQGDAVGEHHRSGDELARSLHGHALVPRAPR